MELFRSKSTDETADCSSASDIDTYATKQVLFEPVWWMVGVLCRKKRNCILWKTVAVDPEKAEHQTTSELKRFHRNDSIVIFNTEGVPVFFSSMFSGSDSALILFARKRLLGDSLATDKSTQETGLLGGAEESTCVNSVVPFSDDEQRLVEQLIQEGQAPFVPANRPYWLQWLLMRFTEVVFCRQTVRYFACGPLRYHRSTLYCFPLRRYPSVRRHVALTIDDGPCRFDDRRNSRLPEVLQLLQKYQATATFMVIARFLTEAHQDDMISLLQQGHELGNHGILDASLTKSTSSVEIGQALDECSAKISDLQHRAGLPEEVRWFRAPHGNYNRRLAHCVEDRSLTNVMCDTYASCPVIQDGEWIGDELARKARDGSIILLHIPERGFRDWCFVALQRALEGLRHRGFSIVSVSELERIANQRTKED